MSETDATGASAVVPTFHEYFCGGGMARLGLGDRWRCAFANDFDAVKGRAYRRNFGAEHFNARDVARLTVAAPTALPGVCAPRLADRRSRTSSSSTAPSFNHASSCRGRALG